MSARVLEIAETGRVHISKMLPGQIGYILNGGQRTLVLRSYNEIVDLERPDRTWSLHASYEAELLPEGSRVEIIAQAIRD